MDFLEDVFFRIISKVHEALSDEDIGEVSNDFTGLCYILDENYRSTFIKASKILTSLFLTKQIINFVMAYDEVVFCMRFNDQWSLKGVNLSLLATALKDLPKSKGYPEVIFGTNETIIMEGLKNVELSSDNNENEIFPIVDFPNLCCFLVKQALNVVSSQLTSSLSFALSPKASLGEN